MKAKKILNSEISELKVSSLPTHPTAPRSMGGGGYGSQEMKEAFDKLPLFIIERYNALIEDITSIGYDSLASSMRTGIKEGHTVSDMMSDISSGEFAAYLTVMGESLVSHIISMRYEIDMLKMKLEKENTEDENA